MLDFTPTDSGEEPSPAERDEAVERGKQAIWNGTPVPVSADALGFVHTTMLNSSRTGILNSGSGIALNNRWILTAKHVRERANIDFGSRDIERIKADFGGAVSYDVGEVVVLGNGPANVWDRTYDLEAYRVTSPMNINMSTSGWRTSVFAGKTEEIIAQSTVVCWGFGNGGGSGTSGVLRFAVLTPEAGTLSNVKMQGESPDPITLKQPLNFFTSPNLLDQQIAPGDSGGPCMVAGGTNGFLVGIVRAVQLAETEPSPKGIVTSVDAYAGLSRVLQRLANVDPERAYFADLDFDSKPDLAMLVAKDDGVGGQYIDIQMQFADPSLPLTDSGFVDFDDLNLLGIHIPVSFMSSAVATVGDFNGNGAADVLAFVGGQALYYDGLTGMTPILHADLSTDCLLHGKCSFFTPSGASYSQIRSADIDLDGYQDVEALTSDGFVETYYGSDRGLTSAVPMEGLPTADGSDGKFLGLSGKGLRTIDRPSLSVWVSVPASQGDFAVEVFDGDLGGYFDDVQASGSHVCYQLTPDPLKNGAPASEESIRKLDTEFPDNAWGTVYRGPVFGGTAPDGSRIYRLDAFIGSSCGAGADSSQPVYNDFKVRATGAVSIANGELSFEGEDSNGPYSPRLPDLLLSDTNYDGTFEFYVYVGAAADELILMDSDADYSKDADAPGRALNANDRIFYTLYDPNEQVVANGSNPNHDPSGNYDILLGNRDIESNTFASPAAGIWRWKWEQLDISNNVHIWAPFASPTTFELMATARKPHFVSSALTAAAWRGEIANVRSAFPVVLGNRNAAGQPVGGSVVVDASLADSILADDQGTLRSSLMATQLAAKLNVVRGAARGERVTNGTVYGTTRAVKDVISDGDLAIANRTDQTDPSAASRTVRQLRAIGLGEINYRPVPVEAPGGITADADADGIINGADNCPVLANADQRDIDANGVGDACQCRSLATEPAATGIVALQYRNGALSPTDNTIRPHFKLSNTGLLDIPLSDIKVRYWYTNEQTRDQVLSVDYAQIGASNVAGTFSLTGMVRDSANSYVEIGFTAAAGTLKVGQSSGEVQTRFSPSDWSNYNEVNDYSYDPSKTGYAAWERMTVYVRGLLVWGREPIPAFCSGGPLTRPQTFRVEYQQGDSGGPRDNFIKPHFRVVNDGPFNVPLSELVLRYWYTEEGGGTEAAWIDYAAIGGENVQLRNVQMSTSRPGADHYLEVSFTNQARFLVSGANTGELSTRFAKTDWSSYDETNDYSYLASQSAFAATKKVTLYRDGVLVWGVEP